LNTTLNYDWTDILDQLRSWAIPGVESVSGSVYRRTILLDGHTGMVHRHGDSLMTVEIDPEGRR
jgi:hypothetical protein